MGTIRSGTGIISGINTAQLIEALVAGTTAQVTRYNQRIQGFQSTQTGYKTLEANLATLTTASQKLSQTSTFQTFDATSSDSAQLSVTAGAAAVPGTYKFQAVRLSSTQTYRSRGFVNANSQNVGAGTLIIANGGGVHRATQIDALNGGNGIRRGVVKITDRAGATANVDLSNVFTVDDVLDAINSSDAIDVRASTVGGKIVITDASGGSSANLSVADLGGGHAAADLGIAQDVAADRITGTDVLTVTGSTLLSQIDDGNGLHYLKTAPAISFSLADGTNLEVVLDGSVTIDDLLKKVNDHADNGGKLTASLENGRLKLVDNTTGSAAFTVANDNGSSVLRSLGLDVDAVGNTVTGRALAAGINSVLLRNVRGGQGITETGAIALRDRSGLAAEIDLTGAESLDEVLAAINDARASGGQKLNLEARANATGNGIEVIDTSATPIGNLIIEDVGTGTLAAQLGIAVNSGTSSVNSGRLNARYVNEATSVAKYAPDGNGIEAGSIRIFDSAGNQATIEISSAVATVGDVIQRINNAAGIELHAELNETGDGFVLIDDAGGSDAIRVEEVDGGTAADLRILGEGTLGSDGRYRISSRLATVVNVEATDTLDSLVAKIQGKSGFVKASVVDDGSAFNPKHLSLAATTSGAAGKLFVDQIGFDLGLTEATAAQDALLRSGTGSGGFLLASSTDLFGDAAPGINVNVLAPGAAATTVTVSRKTDSIVSAVKAFTTGYNAFTEQVLQLTKYDLETEKRGVLQGSPAVLRVQSRLTSIVTRSILPSGNAIRSLVDLGVTIGADGKLTLNEEKLEKAIAANPQLVSDFFATADKGFAAVAQETLKSFTDPFNGALTLEGDRLQKSVDSLETRIETLEAILEVRKNTLLQQFSAMENALGKMQQQTQYINTIQQI